MTPRLFADAAGALYGLRWQSEIARDLDVSDRTVRRWYAGDQPIPPGVAIDLHRLLIERAAAIDELLPNLIRSGAP